MRLYILQRRVSLLTEWPIEIIEMRPTVISRVGAATVMTIDIFSPLFAQRVGRRCRWCVRSICTLVRLYSQNLLILEKSGRTHYHHRGRFMWHHPQRPHQRSSRDPLLLGISSKTTVEIFHTIDPPVYLPDKPKLIAICQDISLV